MQNIPLRYIQRILRVAGSFNYSVERDRPQAELVVPYASLRFLALQVNLTLGIYDDPNRLHV
jgi:hypothetical protein